MKKPKRYWRTRVPLYTVNFHLTLEKTVKELAASRRNSTVFSDSTISADDGAVAWTSYRGHHVGIFLAEEELDHGIVAHEVFHAAHRVLDYVGHGLHIGYPEPHAYLVQWFTDFIYKRIRVGGGK